MESKQIEFSQRKKPLWIVTPFFSFLFAKGLKLCNVTDKSKFGGKDYNKLEYRLNSSIESFNTVIINSDYDEILHSPIYKAINRDPK